MKKKKWRNRKGAGLLALALTLALALSGTGAFDSQAAIAVDVDRKDCRLTVDAGELAEKVEKDYQNAPDAMPDEVKLTVHLYRVADIDVSGKYTSVEYFQNEKVVVGDKELGAFAGVVSEIDSDTTQEEWLAMAEALAAVADRAQEELVMQSKVADESSNYLAEFNNLETGLYLVVPEMVETPYYVYDFTPYLISLPDNYYSENYPNDEWIYDVTSFLKIESVPRQGALEIKKNLISMNGTPGNTASFVFEVIINPLKGEPETRYIRMSFDQTENKSFVVENIPTLSTVTVTEVYSGAGYKIEDGTSDSWQGVIEANDYSDENTPVVSVNFTNESDGTITGGSGVTNHFGKNPAGQYQWTPITGTNDGTQTE